MEFILKQIEPGNPHPIIVRLDKDEVIVGRATIMSLKAYIRVSRQHAAFHNIHGELYIRNIGGTHTALYVNFKKVGKDMLKLEIGDIIGFGTSSLENSDGGFCCVVAVQCRVKQENLDVVDVEDSSDEDKMEVNENNVSVETVNKVKQEGVEIINIDCLSSDCHSKTIKDNKILGQHFGNTIKKEYTIDPQESSIRQDAESDLLLVGKDSTECRSLNTRADISSRNSTFQEINLKAVSHQIAIPQTVEKVQSSFSNCSQNMPNIKIETPTDEIANLSICYKSNETQHQNNLSLYKDFNFADKQKQTSNFDTLNQTKQTGITTGKNIYTEINYDKTALSELSHSIDINSYELNCYKNSNPLVIDGKPEYQYLENDTIFRDFLNEENKENPNDYNKLDFCKLKNKQENMIDISSDSSFLYQSDSSSSADCDEMDYSKNFDSKSDETEIPFLENVRDTEILSTHCLPSNNQNETMPLLFKYSSPFSDSPCLSKNIENENGQQYFISSVTSLHPDYGELPLKKCSVVLEKCTVNTDELPLNIKHSDSSETNTAQICAVEPNRRFKIVKNRIVSSESENNDSETCNSSSSESSTSNNENKQKNSGNESEQEDSDNESEQEDSDDESEQEDSDESEQEDSDESGQEDSDDESEQEAVSCIPDDCTIVNREVQNEKVIHEEAFEMEEAKKSEMSCESDDSEDSNLSSSDSDNDDKSFEPKILYPSSHILNAIQSRENIQNDTESFTANQPQQEITSKSISQQSKPKKSLLTLPKRLVKRSKGRPRETPLINKSLKEIRKKKLAMLQQIKSRKTSEESQVKLSSDSILVGTYMKESNFKIPKCVKNNSEDKPDLHQKTKHTKTVPRRSDNYGSRMGFLLDANLSNAKPASKKPSCVSTSDKGKKESSSSNFAPTQLRNVADIEHNKNKTVASSTIQSRNTAVKVIDKQTNSYKEGDNNLKQLDGGRKFVLQKDMNTKKVAIEKLDSTMDKQTNSCKDGDKNLKHLDGGRKIMSQKEIDTKKVAVEKLNSAINKQTNSYKKVDNNSKNLDGGRKIVSQKEMDIKKVTVEKLDSTKSFKATTPFNSSKRKCSDPNTVRKISLPKTDASQFDFPENMQITIEPNQTKKFLNNRESGIFVSATKQSLINSVENTGMRHDNKTKEFQTTFSKNNMVTQKAANNERMRFKHPDKNKNEVQLNKLSRSYSNDRNNSDTKRFRTESPVEKGKSAVRPNFITERSKESNIQDERCFHKNSDINNFEGNNHSDNHVSVDTSKDKDERKLLKKSQCPTSDRSNPKNLAVVVPYKHQSTDLQTRGQAATKATWKLSQCNLLSLIEVIVQWNPKWLEEQKESADPLPVSKELSDLPLYFRNYEHYVSSVYEIMLLNLWDIMYRESKPIFGRDYMNYNNFYCKVVSSVSKNGLIELQCEAVVSDKLRYSPRKGDVILLNIQDKERKAENCIFGYVNRNEVALLNEQIGLSEWRKIPAKWLENATLCKFDVYIQKREFIPCRTIMLAHGVCNLRSKICLVECLNRFQNSPLCNIVLQPDKYSFKFDKSLEGLSNHTFVQPICEEILRNSKPKVYLIKGCPGSGKTKVILELLEKLLFSSSLKRKIFICAKSLSAVEEIGVRLLELKERYSFRSNTMKFVVVTDSSKVLSKLQSYLLEKVASKACKHRQMKQSESQLFDRLKSLESSINSLVFGNNQSGPVTESQNQLETLIEQYQSLKKQSDKEIDANKKKESTEKLKHLEEKIKFLKVGSYHSKPKTESQTKLDSLMKQYASVKQSVEKVKESNARYNWELKIMSEYDVIVSTVSCFQEKVAKTISNQNLKINLSCCIVDEADRFTEVELLQCLMREIRSLVLVGDGTQFVSEVKNLYPLSYPYHRSMFHRICAFYEKSNDAPVIDLNQQHRINSQIFSYPSRAFYKNQIEVSSFVDERDKSFPLNPYYTLDILDDQLSDSDAKWLVNYICTFILRAVSPVSIGIITTEAQVHMYEDFLSHNPFCRDVEINSVEGFRSKEKDVIVVPLIKMGSCDWDDFVTNCEKLSIALTRARQSFLMYGNISRLCYLPHWKTFCEDALSRNLYIPITALPPLQEHIALVFKQFISKLSPC